jgi:hypothetical protein
MASDMDWTARHACLDVGPVLLLSQQPWQIHSCGHISASPYLQSFSVSDSSLGLLVLGGVALPLTHGQPRVITTVTSLEDWTGVLVSPRLAARTGARRCDPIILHVSPIRD